MSEASKSDDSPKTGQGPPAPDASKVTLSSVLATLFNQQLLTATGLLLLSGFTYIQAFLRYFGLSAFDAGVTPETFVYYAVRPMFGILTDFHNGVGWLLVLGGIAVLGFRWLFRNWPALESARNLIGITGVFALVFVLSQMVARIDAFAIARGEGMRIQFVSQAQTRAADTQQRESPAPDDAEATLPILTAQDGIPLELANASENHELRLVWRTSRYLVVVRHYPNVFCPCSARDGSPGDEWDRWPRYCHSQMYASEPQIPETYLVPISAVGIERVYSFREWRPFWSRWFSERRGAQCSIYEP